MMRFADKRNEYSNRFHLITKAGMEIHRTFASSSEKDSR